MRLKLWVEPEAQNIPERIHYRGDHESPAEFRGTLERLGSQLQQPLEGRGHVVHVPVGDRRRRAGPEPFGRELPVGHAQLALVVAHPEPDMPRGESDVLGAEVRLCAQELRVPALRRRDIVDEDLE
jgi:hypothetical protein